MSKFVAGQIVIADWRDGITGEPNKMRPAVVVQDHELFDESYRAVLVVPITDEGPHVIKHLSVKLDPTAENGCTKVCYVASYLVAATAVARVRSTPSRISSEQLNEIRHQIAECIALR